MARHNGRAPEATTAPLHAPLGAEALRRSCDPQALGFTTTAELAPSSGRIDQDRAAAAIEFALGVPGPGYNMLVTGAPGTGRRTTVETLLDEHAARRPAPADWVYLFNFDEPGRPIAARLPSGRARELAAAMQAFVEAAGQEIPRAFESDSYRERRNAAVPTSSSAARRSWRGSATMRHAGTSRSSSPLQES